MKDFANGVGYFTRGTVEINFPEDDICCHWCPLMGIESKTDRPYCKRTGEYLIVPKLGIGDRCPITFDNKKE